MTTKKITAASKDIRKLRQLIKPVADDRRLIAEKLIDELAFMNETLETLKATVKDTGVVEQFIQGKQNFMRESPALKAYNTTIQRYSLLYKQLNDLLPEQKIEEPKNALADFIQG